MFQFFKSCQLDEYNFNELGGPLSFYKYKYKTCEIILIGETHLNMDTRIAAQYSTIFQKEFKKKSKLKLFIESDQTGPEGPLELSFLNCMKKVALLESQNINLADFRDIEDEITHFFCLLSFIQEQAVSSINKSYNPFFIRNIEKWSHDLNKDFTLISFYNMLEKSINSVVNLEKEYSKENYALGKFLAKCSFKLGYALELLDKVARQYQLIEESNKKNASSLIEITFNLVKNSKSYDVTSEFLEIIELYLQHFYDATLAVGILNELNKEDSPATIMVIVGQSHIISLDKLFNAIAMPVITVVPDKKGRIIPPAKIAEYLEAEFAENMHQNGCSLM